MTKPEDFNAITRLRYEYAFGIDTRNYELLRGVFTAEISMDFSSYNDKPSVTVAADDWVRGVARLFDSLDATQHTMTNPLVDVDPSSQRATQRMAMQAAHFRGGVEFTIGGWYQDSVVRIGDDWKIEAVTLNVTWRRGDPSIMQTPQP